MVFGPLGQRCSDGYCEQRIAKRQWDKQATKKVATWRRKWRRAKRPTDEQTSGAAAPGRDDTDSGSPRQEDSQAAQDSPPQPSEPQNPPENPQPMPLTDRDYYRGKHPAACTCVQCDTRRLGRHPRETPTYHVRGPRRRGFWGWIKWPATGLLVLAMLATVAAMGYHGGSLSSAFTMTTDDYRLLAACPTEVEAFWEFFRRPAQEDYVPMSERYGDGWTDQICNASASQQQSMPTPDTQAMVQAAIEATVQAVTSSDTTPLPVAAATPSPTPNTQATVQAAIEATVQAVTAADAASTPSPTPEPVSAVLPTVTPTPTSTPLPTATPTPDAVATYDELRLFALSLINDDRQSHGLPPVVLGSNPAAQMHANDMIAHDYFGHWWQDGRKPYMVYSETGGASYVSENVATSGWTSRRWAERNCDSFLVNCIVPEVREAIEDAQWDMMYDDAHADWGHRDTILGVSHRAVNLGIAANGRRVVYVQHFEGGDVAADARPSISANGVLSLSVSKIAGGVDIAEQVTIYYDPPPTPKTPEQIDLMDSYCTGGGFSTQCGEPVAAVLRPLGGGSYYVGLERTDVVANGWSETSDKFSFSASMGSLLDAPGVYTVVVWRDSADGWLSEGLVELSFVKQ